MKVPQRDVNLANTLLREAMEMQRFARNLTDTTMAQRELFPSAEELVALEAAIHDAAYAVRYYRHIVGRKV